MDIHYRLLTLTKRLLFINSYPPVRLFAGALRGQGILLGYQVLEAPDIGALWAELYRGLPVLHFVNGFFCLAQGKLKPVCLAGVFGGVYGIQELPDLRWRIAFQDVDGEIGRFGVLDFG